MNMLCIRYFFELRDGEGKTAYYGNYAFYDREPECIEEMFDCPQLSREEERYEAPEWAKGKVVYQIFVDRFASDREVLPEEWYRQELNHKDSLHGSLKGITGKLPWLKELGWMCFISRRFFGQIPHTSMTRWIICRSILISAQRRICGN